jgi:hypothetical protein
MLVQHALVQLRRGDGVRLGVVEVREVTDRLVDAGRVAVPAKYGPWASGGLHIAWVTSTWDNGAGRSSHSQPRRFVQNNFEYVTAEWDT